MTEQTPADAYIESCLIDLSKQLTAAQKRIVELETEVLRIGEVLDMLPIASLEWNSTDQPPPDFAERLLKAWGKIAKDTLTDSIYQKLLRAKYAEEDMKD